MRFRVVFWLLVCSVCGWSGNFLEKTAVYTCPGGLRVKVQFAERLDSIRLEDWSRHQYHLHQTEELHGRKYMNDSGTVIFVLHDANAASLTLVDVIHFPCRTKAPVRLSNIQSPD